MSERTKKIEAIFHVASELSTSEERESYLNEACLGDEGLRKEVDALLKAALTGEELFRGCEQSRLCNGTPVEPLAERPGTMIGRYKLLEKIGEGGMGVVYVAEQEVPVRRKVALKIIKLGMDTRQDVARFEAERQALAMMDHPHIAQVLDAGATETGRPYFVMELVQGVPMTQFCESNRLSVEARLNLFIPVCEAIQSAHQKGIIHRDIKPSNVLVTMHNGTPHPMVIDFGVAKAIEQKLTERTLFTNFGTMIGTPAYMSPEQAEMSKLDVDTRSDIYSLGVLLYELLTGTTPFPEERLRSVVYAEMQRIIAEEEPERPSTRLRKRAATSSSTPLVTRHSPLATDLDWIVMKCLEKDRNRRYETANGLANDIQRHLRDEPVVARPPSAAYRLQKRLRRHRLAFVAGAVVAVALIAGIAASSWQAVRARRSEQHARKQEQIASAQAQLAKEQSETAQAVQQFLTRNLLGGNFRNESREFDPLDVDTKRLLALRIARKIEGQFTNQPLVEAEIRSSLYWAFEEIKDYSNVIIQAEKVLDIYRRLPGPQHSNTLNVIASLAGAKHETGQPNEAYRLMLETEAAQTSTNALTGCAACLARTHGLLLRVDGRYEEALVYLKRALALMTQDGVTNVKEVMGQIAYATELAGRLDEAEELWRDCLQACERDHGPNNPLTVAFRFSLGRLLVNRNRGQAAQPMLEQVVASRLAILGTNHVSTLDAQCWLAQACEQHGEIQRAAEIYVDIGPRAAAQLPFRTARFVGDESAQFFVRHALHKEANLALAPLRALLEANPTKSSAEFETLVRVTGATKGWAAAANLCLQNRELFANSRASYRDMARSLVQERRADEAKALYNSLRESLSAMTPTRSEDMEMLIEATAASLGWSAAADLCRKDFELFPDSLWIWQNKAWIFRNVGDDDSYQRVVLKVLARPPTLLTTNDQHSPVEIAALGPVSFSVEQMAQLDTLISDLEVALPGRSTNQQIYGYRAIGQMQLRLERFDQCLTALEKSASQQTSPDPYSLFIKAICLHRLGRLGEARAAFETGESLLDPNFRQRSVEFDCFVPAWQSYQQLLMHRETKALLGVK